MINLLPTETKNQLRAAHANVALVKYFVILSAGVVFLALACGVSYFILINVKNTNEETKENQQNTNSAYVTAKKQFDEMSADMLAAKNILGQQVLYSNIITGLASALPSGVIMDGLTLSASNISSPVILKAHAISDSTVSQLRSNLMKSALFNSSDVQSSGDGESATSGYPIAITITVTINKGAIQ
jgi:hypothetical protein